QKLVDLVLDLCRAGSAGISILEPADGPGRFRWPAVAGAWAAQAGGPLPRDASPCGVVIDRDAPLLFVHPERHLAYPVAVDPPFAETLLVPFHVGGRPVGTVCAIAHAPDRRFDAEDLRLLTSLSRFAAAGYQTVAALDAAAAGTADLERRVAERAGEVRASDEQYRTLFETMSQGYALCELVRDDRGRAVDFRALEVNPAFGTLTGLDPAAVVGRRFGDILPGVGPFWLDTYAGVVDTGRPARVERELPELGRVFDVAAYPRGGDRFAALFDDITERKRAEDALKASEERQAFLLRLSDALRPLADPIEVQAATGRLLGEHLGADSVNYGVIDESAEAIVVAREFRREGAASMVGAHSFADFAWVFRVLRDGRTVVVDDAGSSPLISELERPAVIALGVAGFVVVPLVKGGRLVGALTVLSTAPRRWTGDEIDLAAETAERTWDAVERARAEAARRESEARLGALFEALPVGVGVADTAGRFTLSNPEMRRFLPTGVIPSRDEVRGWRWRTWHPDGRPVEPADYPGARALRGERVVPGAEMLYRGDDDREVWASVTAAPIRDADGRLTGLVSVINNIDAAKRAGDALRASEERVRQLVTLMPAAVYTCDADGRLTFYNRRAAELWDREPRLGDDDPRWCGSLRMWTPDGAPLAHDRCPMADAAREGRSARNAEVVIERPDGSRVVASVNIDPLYDRAGRVVGAINVFEDVTARKRAEAALAAELDAMTRLHGLSERLLTAPDLEAALGDVLDTALALHGADRGTVQVYDPAADGLRYAAFRGFDPAALDAVPVIDRDFHSTCAAAIRTGRRVAVADLTADPAFAAHAPTCAALGYRAAVSTPLTTRAGEFQGVLTVHFREPHTPTDRELRLADLYALLAAHLIERRRAEDALRESRAFHELVADLGSDWWYSARIDPDGTAVTETVSDGFTRLLGYTRDELMAAGGWGVVVHPDDRPEAGRQMARLLAGETIEGELRHVARGGRVMWSQYRTRPEADAAGRVVRVYGVARDITDRKRTEQELAEGRLRFERIAAATPGVLYVFDLVEGRNVYVNDGITRVLGYSPAEVAALGPDLIPALVHPDDLPGIVAGNRGFDRLADGAVFEHAYRMRHADGSWRWLISRDTVFLRDPDGTARQIIGVAADVTARKAAEAALRASEARHRRLFNSSLIGIFTVLEDGRVLDANDAFLRMVGYTRADLEAGRLDWRAITPPADLAAELAAAETRTAPTGEVPPYEKVYLRKDGTPVPVLLGGAFVEGTSGEGVCFALDITDWKRAEDDLRESEEQFRRAIEDAPIPVIMQAEDGEVLQVSNTWTELTGYALSDVPTADAWLTRAYGPGADAVRAHMHELFRGVRKSLDVEFALRTRSAGDRHWSFSASAPGALRDGRRFLVGMAVDVTARRKAEEAVRASEGRLRAVAANLPGAAVFVVGHDLRYQMAEGQGLRDAGLTPADYEGKVLAEALPPDLAAASEANCRRALGGEPFLTEHAVGGRHFVTRGVPLRGPDGAVSGVLAVSYDITDRKQAEEAVRRARDELEERVRERTAELVEANAARIDLLRRLDHAQEDERRRIARDLHDSLGQLIAALALGLKVAEAQVGTDGPAAGRLKRLGDLTQEIGRETHRLAVELRPTALDDAGLAAAARAYVEAWADRAGIAAEFSAVGLDGKRFPPGAATAVYRAVQEALTNVLKHAGASRVGVLLEHRDGRLTAIVEDDGHGFDPDRAIGTPRAVGGLGLVGMRERAALVNGSVDIESTPGGGTTVYVRVSVPGVP
ncbi:MAG: PAS domain S-box protein, partial [Gemmataceae bacterium]|nr:PAS domain S-box protein [Gemmataceae bacterium]